MVLFYSEASTADTYDVETLFYTDSPCSNNNFCIFFQPNTSKDVTKATKISMNVYELVLQMQFVKWPQVC